MQSLQAYLNSDRQWPRMLRIRHARMMSKKAHDGDEALFWQAVLSANGVDSKGRALASTSFALERSLRNVNPTT